MEAKGSWGLVVTVAVIALLWFGVPEGIDTEPSPIDGIDENAQDVRLSVQVKTHKSPGPPKNLEAVRGSNPGEIDLSWDPPDSQGGSAITDYHVYRSNESGGPYEEIAVLDVSITTYTDTGLPDDTTWYYVVTAENDHGEGSESNEDSATTQSVPDPPANVQAFMGDAPGEIDVVWEPPADDGGSEITDYIVYRADTANGSYAQVAALNGSARSYVDTGLEDNTTYHYAISAVNSLGEGSRSLVVNASTPQVPTEPRDLTAERGDAPGEIDLDWDPPSWNGGLPITEYIVFRSNRSDGVYKEVGRTSNTSFTETESEFGIYHFHVSALNLIGESPRSNASSAIPFPDPFSPVNASLAPSTGEDGWYGAQLDVHRQPATRAPPAGTPPQEFRTSNHTVPGHDGSFPAGTGNASTPGTSTGQTQVRAGPGGIGVSTEGPSTTEGVVRTGAVTVQIRFPVNQTIRVPAMSVPIPAQDAGDAAEHVASRAVPPEGDVGFLGRLMPVTDGVEPTIQQAGEQRVGTVGVDDREETVAVPRYTVSVGGAEVGVVLDLQGASIPVKVFVPEANATAPEGNVSFVSVRLSPQLEGAQPRIDHTGEQEVITISLGDIEETVTVPRHTLTVGGSEVGIEASANGEEVPVLVSVPEQELAVPPR